MKAPAYTIILAAGKGTRMQSDTIPKVCFPVNGVPAIIRAMDIYSQTGVGQFIVVAGGELAGKVISTVGEKFSNVVFAYQKEQNGTAGAVLCALEALTTIRDDEDILLVAGDRIIDKDMLEQFYETCSSQKAELGVLTLHRNDQTNAGHIVCDNEGRPMAILEMTDIRFRAAIAALQQKTSSGETSVKALKNIMLDNFFEGAQINASKGKKAFGSIWDSLMEPSGDTAGSDVINAINAAPGNFVFSTAKGEIVITPEQAAASPLRNNSVYLVKAALLKKAISTFTRDNAQQEIYLSDLLWYAYRHNPLSTSLLTVNDQEKILGFNNPSELLEVERILRKVPERKIQPGLLQKTAAEWVSFLEEASVPGTECSKLMHAIYGDDSDVIARQSAEMLSIAKKAMDHFAADRKLICTRAPGRLNIMGRHVDHQGGNCNLMTISFETIMFSAPREDDTVTMCHANPENFPAAEFKIGSLLAEMPWEDWETVVSSITHARRSKGSGIDWADYVCAAILRMQKKYKETALCGMDIFVGGNIPMAAGLSSSSSLIVCASEACMSLNGIEPFPNQFITLCGESEWFVGTHGGSADHAAVKMGFCGGVTKMRFFDFAVEDMIPFPAGYSMLVCDSGIKARKSSNARDQFNHRVCCYKLGFRLIRKNCPQFSGVLHHLRDVNTGNLHVPLKEIYKILLALPENPTRTQLENMLPDEELEPLFSGHDSTPDRTYPIRNVVMFGLSEMKRSADFSTALKNMDFKKIGDMFRTSHNGDRVAFFDKDLSAAPYTNGAADNNAIMKLMDDLDSGDIDRVTRAQLDRQEGAYGCSIPEIDMMVDIANATPGVIGAQLAGAGLGGCMMILAKDDAIPRLKENLCSKYYAPAGLAPQILVCRPIAGAGTLKN